MKKNIKSLIVLFCLIIGMAGCTTNKNMSYTYILENKDIVKVTLNISEGHSFTYESPFRILKGKEQVGDSIFIIQQEYYDLVNNINSNDKITIIDSGFKDGNEYIFWNFDNSQFDYAIKVANSNTAIIIANDISEESAKETFDRFKIEKVEKVEE